VRPSWALGLSGAIAVGIAGGIVGGIAFVSVNGMDGRIAFGIAEAIAFWLASGLTLGITHGLAFGVTRGMAAGISVGIANGIGFGIRLGTAVGITRRIALGVAFVILFGSVFVLALGMVGGIACGMAGGIAYGTVLLRTYYQLVHPFFVWPKVHGHRYRYHPVAWDDVCSLPFPGLDRLLVAYTEEDYIAGLLEMARLVLSCPSQYEQVLRAQVRLLAREAARETNLARLDEIVAKLKDGEGGFLNQTRQIRETVNEIAVQQRRLDMLERPFLREPTAQLLYTEIENFQHRIAGFREPLASGFRTASEHWKEIALRQLEEARAIVSKEPTPQVFRAGDPVDRDREAFVPRHAIMGQVDQQVALATGCPGIVLYGRRRTGKSTVLHNLKGFLPASLIAVTVSMQDPQAFTSPQSFARLLALRVRSKTGVTGVPDDLSGLYDFLTNCNSRLQSERKRLLLAVDEYELLDSKIAQGVFAEDLLRMFRESIQSHRNITWILSGSHEITELTGAPWTSYLVSARTIEVTVFNVRETRQLLTEPVMYSSLWKKDDPRRPRFEPGFWGEGGIERIHEEAGGWPHLVQLIAEAVVDLINDEKARLVSPALLQRALAQCVVRGHNVLHELMHRECTLPGEWEYLSAFRREPEQPPPEGDAVNRSLRRRLLVTEENGHWRLRVPLMARWLRERG
jgi:hypothetical protein